MEFFLISMFIAVIIILPSTVSNENIYQGTEYSEFDKHVDNMTIHEIEQYIIEHGLGKEFDGYSVATIKERIKGRHRYFN